MSSTQMFLSDIEIKIRRRDEPALLGRFDINEPLKSPESRASLKKVWEALDVLPLRVGQIVHPQNGNNRKFFEMDSTAVTEFYEKHPEGVLAKGLVAERPFITCVVEGFCGTTSSLVRMGRAAWDNCRGLLTIAEVPEGVIFAGEYGNSIATLAKVNFIDRYTGELSVPKLLSFLVGERLTKIESDGSLLCLALRDPSS